MSASANRIGLVHTRRCGAMALVLEDEARAYLLRTGYWRSVERLECGLAVQGGFGVFLAEAEPAAPDVDRAVGVVVGDLPPLYLVTDDIETPEEALTAYIDHRRAWVDAVRANLSVADLAPVDVEPTREWAAALATRLRLLEEFLAEEGWARGSKRGCGFEPAVRIECAAERGPSRKCSGIGSSPRS